MQIAHLNGEIRTANVACPNAYGLPRRTLNSISIGPVLYYFVALVRADLSIKDKTQYCVSEVNCLSYANFI